MIAIIVYDNLWKTMKEKNITQYRLIKSHDFCEDLFRRLKRGCSCSTYTLVRLCVALDCKIEDIVTFIPNDEVEKD